MRGCARNLRFLTYRIRLDERDSNANVANEEVQRIGHGTQEGPFNNHYISSLELNVRLTTLFYLGQIKRYIKFAARFLFSHNGGRPTELGAARGGDSAQSCHSLG